MKRLRSIFCDHTWSQWEEISKAVQGVIHKEYKRTCRKCGKTETK